MNFDFCLDGWWVGILTYALSHLCHILIWRKKRVTAQLRTLLVIFVLGPFMAYGGAWIFFFSPGQIVLALATHVILGVHYISIYPAFQATSPTIELLSCLRNHRHGVSQLELVKLLGSGIVANRVEDLKRGGLLIEDQEKVVLSVWGKALALVFEKYRLILGLPLDMG